MPRHIWANFLLLTGLALADPAEYAQAFREGRTGAAQGLCGRILRGQDFTRLTDDPRRKLVFVLGEDGLDALVGKSRLQMLEMVGYTPAYIRRKVDEGSRFKLVVFRQEQADLATWDNAVRLTGEAYPEAETRLRRQLPALRSTSFEMGSWADVDRMGPGDPRFVTLDRYLTGPDSAAAARAFLYFTVHLRELFQGDGRTHPGGLREYLTLDRPLTELGDYRLLDL